MTPRGRRPRRLALALLVSLCVLLPARQAAAVFAGMSSDTYHYGPVTVSLFIDDSWCGAYHCFAFGKARGGAYVAISAPDPHTSSAAGLRPDGTVDLIDLASSEHQTFADLAALVREHPELASARPTILAREVRGLLPTNDTYFSLRLVVMWLLFAPTWFAAVLVYLAADRERNAVTRTAYTDAPASSQTTLRDIAFPKRARSRGSRTTGA
jgi:hypothetical protein